MKKFGNNSWTISYHPVVFKKDMKALDAKISRRIFLAVEHKLLMNPLFYGIPLHGTLDGFFKFRVGDWRVIYGVSGRNIKILMIGRRKTIYNDAEKRLG